MIRVQGQRALLGLGADRLLRAPALFHRSGPLYPRVARAAEVLPIAELPPEDGEADRVLAEAARRAAAVVVFSEDYARRVAQRYELDPARIHRTPVGCEHWTRAHSPRVDAGREGPLRVLALGALIPDREPHRLVEGFDRWVAAGRDAGCRAVFPDRTGEIRPDGRDDRAC